MQTRQNTGRNRIARVTGFISLLLMFAACHSGSPAATPSNPSPQADTAQITASTSKDPVLQKDLSQYYKSLPALPDHKGKLESPTTEPTTVVTDETQANDDAPMVEKDGETDASLHTTEQFRQIIPTTEDLKNLDFSPLTTLQNLMCHKAGTGRCLHSLNPAIEQAIGYYYHLKSAALDIGGSLVNAAELPEKGQGYRQKPNSRDGRFATDHAIHFIQAMAKLMEENHIIDFLVIGDIAKQDGGKFPGHDSHQSGLDLDIGFLPSSNTQSDLEHFPKNSVAQEKLTKNFGMIQNWQLVSSAVKTGWTYLILAHPSVKKAFCQMAAKSPHPEQYNEMLSQIVPDVTHYDHFHFRLKCPESSPRCLPGPVRPTASGCEAFLGKAAKEKISTASSAHE